MRKLVLIFLLISFGLPISSKAIYVSSISGSLTNNGLNSDSPIASLSTALTLADTVYVEAGSYLYGGVTIKGKVVKRYGDGHNPTICGFKRLVAPDWQEAGENIWKICLTEANYEGVKIAGSSASNNICCLYEYDKDLIHGRKVRYAEEMTQDWDFWQTEKIKDAAASDYDNLYLYYTGNPNDLSLGFSIYDTGISCSDCTIDGINLIGFGFGIGARSNTVIRNCKIDVIGGRMIDEGYRYTCYGNGIEFYVSQDISDCLVEHCQISRCYDCGVTIQGSNCGSATPRNIIIRNNLISNCCEGWEDFLRNDTDVVYENCIFDNNVVLDSGNSGFGYTDKRAKYCHVLGNNIKGNKGMIIRNNLFIGGNFYCSGAYNGEYKSNKWEGNVCFLSKGDYMLSNYIGTEDVLRVPEQYGVFDCSSYSKNLEAYRELTGDYSTRFQIVGDARIDKLITKNKESFLKKHRY